MNCEFCNSPAHIWYNCPKRPDGWKPERLRTKSGKEPNTTRCGPQGDQSRTVTGGERPAQDQNLDPISINAKPKFNRAAYQREYMRKRRAKLKEGK